MNNTDGGKCENYKESKQEKQYRLYYEINKGIKEGFVEFAELPIELQTYYNEMKELKIQFLLTDLGTIERM